MLLHLCRFINESIKNKPKLIKVLFWEHIFIISRSKNENLNVALIVYVIIWYYMIFTYPIKRFYVIVHSTCSTLTPTMFQITFYDTSKWLITSSEGYVFKAYFPFKRQKWRITCTPWFCSREPWGWCRTGTGSHPARSRPVAPWEKLREHRGEPHYHVVK